MKKTFIFIVTFTSLLLTACADNTATNSDSKTSFSAAPVQQAAQTGDSYQVFDKPFSDGISLDYTILAKDQDPLIVTLAMADESDESKGFAYHGYTLRENGWEDTSLPWGEAFNKQFPQGFTFIRGDSDGRIYIEVNDPQKGILLFQMGDSTDYREIDLSEIKKAYKDYEAVDIQFVTDDKIAILLQQSDEDAASEPAAVSSVVIFDLIRQKITDKGNVIGENVAFTEDGTYYAVSSSGQYIQHYTIHDKMPDRVIQCIMDGEDMISEESARLGLDIVDDTGYIVTKKGICTGKLSDDKWDTLALPIDQFYYNKNDAIFKTSPVSSINTYAKLPGDNGDFILSTLVDSESSDYKWVRYSL